MTSSTTSSTTLSCGLYTSRIVLWGIVNKVGIQIDTEKSAHNNILTYQAE